jgi:hypothetical protein
MADKLKFNKPTLRIIFSALCDAVDWQDSLADSWKHEPKSADLRRAKAKSLQYANIREQIGEFLRGA